MKEERLAEAVGGFLIIIAACFAFWLLFIATAMATSQMINGACT